MTAFWRPIADARCVDDAPHKQLGHGLYELWSRCDLCFWSGPMPNFALGVKGGFTAEFCSRCMTNGRNLEDIQAAGWIWQ